MGIREVQPLRDHGEQRLASPHEVFFGDRPPMPVFAFCKPAYHRVRRRTKMDPRARPRFSLSFGYDHKSDCFKIMDAETGTVANLGTHYCPPWNAMVRRLAERQDRHRRAAPEEYFVRGKHAAVRCGRGGVEPLGCPQNQTPSTSLSRPDLEIP